MAEQYEGRLVCDGDGNLLADEGSKAGYPVAYKDGAYYFLDAGEPSHNAQHEKNVLEMQATQDVDPELPGYVDKDDPDGNEHHWETGNPGTNPDAVAPKRTGHTDAYKEGGN